MMNAHPPNLDAWEECPPGELSRMVRRIHDGRRRRTAAQSALVVAVVVMAVASAWQFFPSRSDFSYGQITCTEVEAGMRDYVAGNLSAERAEQYRLHLDHCPRCKALLEQMGGRTDHTVAGASNYGRLILADGSRWTVRGAARP